MDWDCGLGRLTGEQAPSRGCSFSVPSPGTAGAAAAADRHFSEAAEEEARATDLPPDRGLSE